MNQPFFCEGSEAMVALEAMVDKVGLRNVLYALASICEGKADHLRANWQDEGQAQMWTREMGRLHRQAVGTREPGDSD